MAAAYVISGIVCKQGTTLGVLDISSIAASGLKDSY